MGRLYVIVAYRENTYLFTRPRSQLVLAYAVRIML